MGFAKEHGGSEVACKHCTKAAYSLQILMEKSGGKLMGLKRQTIISCQKEVSKLTSTFHMLELHPQNLIIPLHLGTGSL